MNQTPQVRASEVAAQMMRAAADAGKPILRMSNDFPSMQLTRKPLYVWIDKGRVRTSDGPMKGHQICSAMVDVREDSAVKRTVVLPSLSDARRLLAALGRAKFTTADQRNSVFAGRRTLQVAIATPWFSPVLIVSRALSFRYWKPDGATDDIDSWARHFGVSSPRSGAGLDRLAERALKGTSTWGSIATRLNSTSERVLKAQSFLSPVNDAQTMSGMEAIGDLWRVLTACDATLRPYSLASRKTVAVRFDRPDRESNLEYATIPAGSIPFRERSTVWVVDPLNKKGGELSGGSLTGFGFEDGVFRIVITPAGKSGRWSCREVHGRQSFLVEAPFGGAPRFSRPEGSSWDNGVPPIEKIDRSVPAELSLAGMPVA